MDIGQIVAAMATGYMRKTPSVIFSVFQPWTHQNK